MGRPLTQSVWQKHCLLCWQASEERRHGLASRSRLSDGGCSTRKRKSGRRSVTAHKRNVNVEIVLNYSNEKVSTPLEQNGVDLLTGVRVSGSRRTRSSYWLIF